MRKISKIILFLLLTCAIARAGTYSNLTPGLSTKGDADRALGQPVKEVVKEERYDYAPGGPDTERVSITFDRSTGRVESIEIHTRNLYGKKKYLAWFGLSRPKRVAKDDSGNLLEYYTPQGIALHFSGPEDSSFVLFFSHFDPRPTAGQTRQDFERAVLDAFYKKRDFALLKRVLNKGLRRYPESPRLWTFLAKYHFFKPDEKEKDWKERALSAASKALHLAPENPKHFVNIGYIYQEGFSDCGSAISYFKAGVSHGKLDPRLYFHMARCYEELGESELAKRHFRMFLDVSPSCRLAPLARRQLDILSTAKSRRDK
jgi:tetratricopeptide (TPR) repeat protein